MRSKDLDNWLSEVEAEAEVIGPESGVGTATAEAVTDSPVPEPIQPEAPRETLSDLWSPDDSGTTVTASDVAGLLLDRQQIGHDQANQARTVARQASGKTLAEVLIEMGVDEGHVQQAVADQSHMPLERFEPDGVDKAALDRLGNEYCKANGVIPIRMAGARIIVGVTDPRRLFVLDEVRRKLGRPVKVVLVTSGDLRAAV